MSKPNPPRSKTVLTNLTRVVHNLQERVHFSKLVLRKDARVPELWVQEPGTEAAKIYPLLGDRYTIGRSSKSSDIVIRNPIVSQLHATLKRDPKHRRIFTIRDEQSTNGIFRNRRRLKTYELSHKDVLTLGPPDLESAVRVQFIDPPPLPIKLLRSALYGISGLFGAATIGTAIAWHGIPVNPLPTSQQGPVVVLARDQTPLVQVRLQGHVELKKLSDYSPHVIQALLASEDSRFYWHAGVDPLGILRAILTNVFGGSLREGGSTLTQQLARSLYRGYVGTEDSLGRKGREAIVALKLEAFYSKDFLLLNYLNKVYLGAYASGFEDAAQFYFGKSAKNLSVSEAATLVGILPAPNSFNPIQNYSTAVEYRNRVISRMAEQGRISNEEAERARRSRIEISPKAKAQLQSAIAPYYYSYVFDELEQLLGKDLAQEGNFIVETALDPNIQSKAESSLSSTIENEGAASGFSQGALVTTNFRTGEILAMVGGKDYRKSQFNRATQALRQPGSTFKLFTYTAALEAGISPSETFSCAPVDWDGQLFSGCSNGGAGALDLTTGVMLSENPIALRVAQRVGLSRIIQTARRLGVQSTLEPVPGLVLGQSETTLLEMSRAYAVVANQGREDPPLAIRKILDAGDCKSLQDLQTCRVIYDRKQDLKQSLQPLSQEVANTMTQILTGVVRSGTGRAAALGLGEAGKTGTTNDNRDLWFIGFIPNQNLLTGIWLGNDDNQPTDGNSGQAAALWGRFMRTIL
ncbi:transglycosylase domain-containing protein [Altericista sp. CCNU0014]|uniref:transglycosylase domain-containing protein n=1 Tax=Altericista sp. CCNU0014 TaxID=3082949 RepID=UPI00384E1010